MLTTKTREPLEILVDASSSTVTVGPGIVQFGTDVARFDGSRIPYQNMTSLYGTSLIGNYQLSVLSMSYYYGAVDMTCYDSTMSTSLGSLTYPSQAMPSTGQGGSQSGQVASARAVGAFTFHNVDGTTIKIESYSKVM